MATPFSVAVALVATSLSFVTALAAQDAAPPAPACDRTAIEWVLPGDFDTALGRAREEQRILVVKGISFGVDTQGARCATRGVW